MNKRGKAIRDVVLREVGNVAFHLASHYHVFVVDDFRRVATTRSVALPFHRHRVMTNRRNQIPTEPAMATGAEHKHEIVFKGKRYTSGVPL